MDSLPYEFHARVASIIAPVALRHLADLPILKVPRWVNAAESQLQNRFSIKVVINTDHVMAYATSVSEAILPLNSFLGRINRFTRVTEVCVYSDFPILGVFPSQENQLRQLGNFLKTQYIGNLYIHSSIHGEELLRVTPLWLIPAKKVYIPDKLFCDQLLDFHLLENFSLDEIVVFNASYDFMWRITEAYKRGEKQALWKDTEDSGKIFEYLDELGFKYAEDRNFGQLPKQAELVNIYTRRKLNFLACKW
ncbi:hypothetical protein L596_010051 [Steinernema carpocapsae]|uniref:Uncharacterized protein n=1 Tax=Steinernema carpocapsae TaxID=34508 RepID=A0A4U5PHN7_STECR|nr:hypothetical protein L596_010051 [Steinernema carpocapsae]